MHLGLIGYGNIATSLIKMLDGSRVTSVTVLVRAAAPHGAPPALAKTTLPVRFVTDRESFLAVHPDLIVECAGHPAVAEHVPALLAAGHDVIVASVGALADETLDAQLNAATAQAGARLILPSGAIGGLDLLRAVALAGDVEVTYTGTKPPLAWVGSAAEDRVDLTALDQPATFFQGTGRAAALAFPKNANVVAALALAGAGFDRMQVNLIADPQARGNQHSYSVASPLCRYTMSIEATPSSGNARTSQTTVLSIFQEITAHRAAPSHSSGPKHAASADHR